MKNCSLISTNETEKRKDSPEYGSKKVTISQRGRTQSENSDYLIFSFLGRISQK